MASVYRALSEMPEDRRQMNLMARSLFERPDLLAKEALLVSSHHINWRGRLAMLGDDYGSTGGSALDRRAIIEFMAALETEVRG